MSRCHRDIGVLSFRIDQKARHACYDRGFSKASELIDRAEWYVRMQLVAEGLQARLIAPRERSHDEQCRTTNREEVMATDTVPESPRRPTPLVCVRPGLWVARPTAGSGVPETVEERGARRLAKRAVFARPLLPRGGRASGGRPKAADTERDDSAAESR